MIRWMCTHLDVSRRPRCAINHLTGDPARPPVSLDVMSLVASSCGYSRGYIEQHATQSFTVHAAPQTGRAKRLPHRHSPRVQFVVPVQEQRCRRPRLPPRRGTAQVSHHDQGHPGGTHGRSNAPIASDAS